MGDLGGESPLKVEKLYSSQVGLEDPKGPSTFQARRCELPECRAAHGKSSLFPLTTQNVIFYDQDILYMTFENLTHLSSKMLNILEIFFFFFFFFFFCMTGFCPQDRLHVYRARCQMKMQAPVQKLLRISKWRQQSIKSSTRPF